VQEEMMCSMVSPSVPEILHLSLSMIDCKPHMCLILGADFYYYIESVIQCSCLILFVPFLIVFVS
jgi:hypothetical protein